MVWEPYVDEIGYKTKDWIAKGSKGHFLIHKDGNYIGSGWRTLYMDDSTHEVLWRGAEETWWEAKQSCQNSKYWEN